MTRFSWSHLKPFPWELNRWVLEIDLIRIIEEAHLYVLSLRGWWWRRPQILLCFLRGGGAAPVSATPQPPRAPVLPHLFRRTIVVRNHLDCVIKYIRLKGCSHDAITIEIYFSQLMGCMGFSVVIAIVPCEHLLWISYYPFVAIKIVLAIASCEQPLKVVNI